MKKPLLLIAILAANSLGFADQAIWSGKLVNGWQDWSWAKVDKSGPTMKAVAKAWEGVYFHHASEKSAGFKAITFSAKGGAKGGQRLQFEATVGGKPLKGAFVVTLKPGWKTFSVPLERLGLVGQAFDGLWMQAMSAESFEIKNVKLKGK